jgi:ATP-dependent Clp protease ATP-binding subunit ClpA
MMCRQSSSAWRLRCYSSGAIPDFEGRCTKFTSPVNVTADVVANIVSDATGFPVDKLKATEQDTFLNLDAELAEQVRI